MKAYRKIMVLMAAVAAVLASCRPRPADVCPVDALPPIFPDYAGVTIPAGIAPLNFGLEGDTAECIDVQLAGTIGGCLHAQGSTHVEFDADDWHSLTALNAGGSITVSVCERRGGRWLRYRDFAIHVSPEPLDDYGLVYRRIPPGYEVGGDLGIYQRCLHNFDESPLLTETALPGRCFNCHTANRANPQQFTMQVRGEGGGTLVQTDGCQVWYDTKTPATRAAGSYAYWHPEGRYVAYAAAAVYQSFFVGKGQPIEVYHKFSNIVVLDRQTDTLLADSLLLTDCLEIFPAFSADGRRLFFSTSESCNVPAEYLKVKCSLCAIGFDAESGRFATHADTLLSGPRDDCSYVMARPSYDGRWLAYVQCSRSNFPIAQPDADIRLMDLATGRLHELPELNSRHTDSYPNWSTNSRWMVFASRRLDGKYTRLFIASVDEHGRATKPFLLPQRNPWKYYNELFDAYNCPDFTSAKVSLDVDATRRAVESGRRTPVSLKSIR